jgi:hypothetical protein
MFMYIYVYIHVYLYIYIHIYIHHMCCINVSVYMLICVYVQLECIMIHTYVAQVWKQYVCHMLYPTMGKHQGGWQIQRRKSMETAPLTVEMGQSPWVPL